MLRSRDRNVINTHIDSLMEEGIEQRLLAAKVAVS